MIDCLNAARYFIVRAYEDGIEAEMTNMKVQKLLYYSQSLHLALYDEPLFNEEIQAWRYGPVCPPAYRFYSEFEANQLPVPNQDFLLEISDEKKKILSEIWEYFGGYHAYRPQASSTEPILQEDMKALGYQKLDLIEREHPIYESLMAKTLEDAINTKSSNRINKGEVGDWLNSLLD
jgi:uncharacterized phage-associated protein